MTLDTLARELANLVEKYPEYANFCVSHASECGESTADFHAPLTIAIPIYTSEFQDCEPCIRLVSNDDGYDTNRAISGWNFYNKHGKVKMEYLYKRKF